jgi:hypothetical protein
MEDIDGDDIGGRLTACDVVVLEMSGAFNGCDGKRKRLGSVIQKPTRKINKLISF